MEYFALQSFSEKSLFRISNTEYDSVLPKTIRKGLIINPELIKSVNIKFDTSGEVIPDYVYHQAGIPIISENFKEFLENELSDEIKFFQIEKIKTNINDKSQFYLINILEIIDCVDFENSEIKLYEGTSVIEKAQKIKFLEGLINQRNIFRVNRIPKDYFISNNLADAIISNKLNGIKLIPLEEYVSGF
jgi:hypothetical protein